MKIHLLWRSVFASVLSILLAVSCLFQTVHTQAASKSYSLVVLSQYNTTLSIGEEFYLAAVASNGQIPSYKSSNSKIASVNSYGLVTAKKPGTCRITAKVSSGEASCKVKVEKTKITIASQNVSLENGQTFELKGCTSNGSIPTYTSNKKSVAVVDSNGVITACKPGSAVISIAADSTKLTCRVTVKNPTIALSQRHASLYRNQQFQLSATVSSGKCPIWKSSKSSVASVNENGLVVAWKHGTAVITAKVDGISKTCEVEVLSPVITLAKESLTMKKGQSMRLDYSISSGNAPLIKSSKPNVVKVDQLGNLTAKNIGTSVISFSEDGTRETCTVKVTK